MYPRQTNAFGRIEPPAFVDPYFRPTNATCLDAIRRPGTQQSGDDPPTNSRRVLRRRHRSPGMLANLRHGRFELSAYAIGRKTGSITGSFGTFAQTLTGFIARARSIQDADADAGEQTKAHARGHGPKPAGASITIRECTGQTPKKQIRVHRSNSPSAVNARMRVFAHGFVIAVDMAARMPRSGEHILYVGETNERTEEQTRRREGPERRGFGWTYLQKPSMQILPGAHTMPAVGSHSFPRLPSEPQTS